jgi:molybdopterin converting factor small subunit
VTDAAEFDVRLFAAAKQFLGSVARVSLESPYTVARLRAKLAALNPQISALVAQSRIAVNANYAAPEQTIAPTDEIALIPPVSGG